MSIFTGFHHLPVVQLRGLPWIALEDSAVVARSVFADDLGGAGTHAFTPIGTYDARVDPLAGESGELAGRINERSTQLITMAPDVDVTTDDRITVNGVGYEITIVRERTQEELTELEAIEES